MKHYLTSGLIFTALAMTGCISVIDAGNDDVNSSSYSHSSSVDERKIKAVVYDYFDGQGMADFERLDRAFDDGAAMFGVRQNDEGEEYLRVWSDMNTVIERWGNNPNPHGERESDILDIQITDGRIATVHFKSADRFYDVLTLVKIEGDWTIASKVFVSQ